MSWLATLALGAAVVFQSALNRKISGYWGLWPAILMNNVVILFLSGVGYLCAKQWFSESWPTTWPGLWVIIPGFLGFAFVAGLPLLIGRIGAASTFVGIVAAQLVCGLAWDYFVENKPLAFAKIIGCLLAVVGAVIAR